MLMNPQLEGILNKVPEEEHQTSPTPAQAVHSGARGWPQRMRLLMALLPVPLYCGIEVLVGIENLNALWALLLTPVALLWYSFEYLWYSLLVRHVLKEVSHYGLFLTPPVTLFVAGLQPAGEAWPLAKTMLLWSEATFCGILVFVLWRNRQVGEK